MNTRKLSSIFNSDRSRKKKLITLLLFFIPFGLISQDYCNTKLFGPKTRLKPERIEYIENVTYAQSPDYSGSIIQLQLDIAYPKFLLDRFKKKPCILMIHGGGFISGDKTQIRYFSEELVRKGYIVAMMNYRKGWDFGTGKRPSDSCTGHSKELLEAIYRSVQDTRAALRFLDHYAEEYGIDRDNMFLCGFSAGAVCAIHTLYLNQNNFKKLDPDIVEKLGALNAMGNNLNQQVALKGIISISGGIADTAFIDPDENTAVLMFHGKKDNIIPFESGRPYNCDENSDYPVFYGSRAIANRLRNLGNCYEMHVALSSEHSKLYTTRYQIISISAFIKKTLCSHCQTREIFNYGEKPE
jgi:predicted esterase